MAKSQYEADLERRQRREAAKQPRTSGGVDKRIWYGIAAVAVAALVVFAVTGRESTAAPTTFAGNYEAFGLADDPVYGNASAQVALIAFESPQCSGCQHFHLRTWPGLKEQFFDTGDAGFYYLQSRWGGEGDNGAMVGGIASECAWQHGGDAFWDFLDDIYGRGGNIYAKPDYRGMLSLLASEHDLGDDMVDCFDDRSTSRMVSKDWNVADDWDARGTPTFFVIGHEGEAAKVDASSLASVLQDRILAAGQATS